MPDALSIAEPPVALCGAPTRAPLGAAEAVALAGLFRAVADPARLRLLSMIAAGSGGEACVCDLTGPLDLAQPTVSHHLKVLVDAGLVAREKRGKWAYYSIVPGALDSLGGALRVPESAERDTAASAPRCS